MLSTLASCTLDTGSSLRGGEILGQYAGDCDHLATSQLGQSTFVAIISVQKGSKVGRTVEQKIRHAFTGWISFTS
jgi:hypothetical protein